MRRCANKAIGHIKRSSKSPPSLLRPSSRASRPQGGSSCGHPAAQVHVDDQPVQLVNVYYDPELVAGSKLEQPVLIEDGVHAELRRLGVHLTRLVEDFLGARLPNTDEQRLLQLPSGVPVTRNIRTASAGEQPVEVLDTISNGEVVSYRFEIKV